MANCSSRLRLRLRWAKVSVALPKIAMCRQPELERPVEAALVGDQHRQLPALLAEVASISRVIRSPASASWGTHFGWTKLVASTTGSPAASSRRMNSALASTGTMPSSFCRPSRGPTS